MEFFIGLISGICICTVIYITKFSSKESKREKEELERLERNKILEEHRSHKYRCILCGEKFYYNDMIIQDGELCCPYCGREISDNGYYK